MSLLKVQTVSTTLRPYFKTCMAGCLSVAAVCSFAQPSLDFVTGKALFEKQWVFAPASTGASDGLGPYFNARSCNECHQGGGRGEGDIARTVHIADRVYGEQLQKYTRPGIPAEARISVRWSDPEVTRSLPVAAVEITDLHYGPMRDPAVSLRFAPALYGLAELESIPASVIESMADPNDEDGDGISGRVNRLRNGEPGRFGWKASQPSIRNQVGRALSLDLGLGNPVVHSGHGDCTSWQTACLDAPTGNDAGSLEVSEQALELLLAYVRGLKAPPPVDLSQPGMMRGSELFSGIGCAQCHFPEISSNEVTLAPYTDLLLHDMGPGLADQLTEESAAGEEWRTPPLWGLATMRGNFLHDGRARNLREAILWHDGEGRAARQAFLELNSDEQSDVFTFLGGL